MRLAVLIKVVLIKKRVYFHKKMGRNLDLFFPEESGWKWVGEWLNYPDSSCVTIRKSSTSPREKITKDLSLMIFRCRPPTEFVTGSGARLFIISKYLFTQTQQNRYSQINFTRLESRLLYQLRSFAS